MSSYVNKFFSAVGSALEFNAATLSGAIDIIVVEDDDGVRRCSPFHVRFGKLQLLKSRGMAVDVWLNDVKTDLTLRLGTAGEAYFVAPDLEGGAATPHRPAEPALAIDEGSLSTPPVPDAVATATAEPTSPRTSPPAGAGEPSRVLSSAHDGDLGADRQAGLGADAASNGGDSVASDLAAGPETEVDASAAVVAAVVAPTCGSVNPEVTAEADVEAGPDAHAGAVWTPTGAVGAVGDITSVAASQLCRARELAGDDALGRSPGVACSAARQTAAVAPVDVTAAAPGPSADPAVSAVGLDGAPADATESSATPPLPVGAPSTPPPPLLKTTRPRTASPSNGAGGKEALPSRPAAGDGDGGGLCHSRPECGCPCSTNPRPATRGVPPCRIHPTWLSACAALTPPPRRRLRCPYVSRLTLADRRAP
ncbi:hypothetical protein BU14_0129s0001 [Porphyra umbilicalis]|uniref:Lipin N-terminal domain-containing protein n=1 Tax=Porphyra umbilicalis TaxID=2786 RepID=A0A1X6PAX5_PORUM|nr:hypothetical protein BU14_0129s0001 [Porphyra umbilicalis]|eukprot:OSX77885.1 hypothetical protein BU14_0129s0001 [Porphyra umbilicalis]